MKGNNTTLEYIYEYMVKKAVPVAHYPATFHTVMVNYATNHHKKVEFLFPYDNESILDVIGILLLNSDSEDEQHAKFVHRRPFGTVLIAATKGQEPVRDKYPFHSQHLSLIEFYDLLQQINDPFIVTLKLEVFFSGSGTTAFRISLNMVTIMNSDGMMGSYLKREIRERWFKIGSAQSYHYNFYQMIDKELDIPIYRSTYILNEKERED